MPSRYALYVLGLMVGINLLNYMDRWVGSAVAPLIQAEFDLSDFSIGLLGSAFTSSMRWPRCHSVSGRTAAGAMWCSAPAC